MGEPSPKESYFWTHLQSLITAFTMGIHACAQHICALLFPPLPFCENFASIFSLIPVSFTRFPFLLSSLLPSLFRFLFRFPSERALPTP